jgi:anti-anti-sigma regulatory factor
MSGAGQSLKLCSVNKTIREVLELTDLAAQFDQFDDATSAVRSFL